MKNKISNMKGSKGITLVALIITIIILLILAVVAIGAVNNTGIIQYAQNSADEYTDGRDEENTTLQNYMDVLNHYNLNKEPSNPLKEIAGLYYGPNMNLELTEDGKLIGYVGDATIDGGNFVYNTNTKTVTLIGQEFKFIKDGEYKLLVGYDTGDYAGGMLIYTTGGTDTLARPENGTYSGTYTENETTHQVKAVVEDGKITYYKGEATDGEEIDSIVYDKVIYRYGDDETGIFDSLFKISPDGNTLTGYGKWDGAILTKE